MDTQYVPFQVSTFEVLFFALTITVFFISLFIFAIVSNKLQNPKRCVSPYTGKPMWFGEFVPLSSVKMIMKFLYYDIHGYDNRVFPMKNAMFCRDTGRIFPGTAPWWGYAKIDWSFLAKKYPGTYVSWGSLSAEHQEEIRKLHGSLEGFQTEISSPNPSPRAIEEKYVFTKPGPLYVDLTTYTLLGWKSVPETKFEVLIVQKPKTLSHTLPTESTLSLSRKKRGNDDEK
jgi:hypothetical protein